MHSIEGGIASTESQIRDFSTVSAVRETGINIEISRKKKRLNADLDSLIDRLQVKKEEFMALDEKCVAKL